MKNKNLSKAQMIVGVVAILLATVLAFCPVISVPLQPDVRLVSEFSPVLLAAAANETDASQASKYIEIGDSFIDSETTVTHSGISLVASLPSTFKFVSAWITSIQLENHQQNISKKMASDPNYLGSSAALNDLLRGEELQEKLERTEPSAVSEASVGNVRLLLNGFVTMAADGSFGGDAVMLQVIGVMIASLFNFLILAMALILFPIKMLVAVVKLLPALASKQESAYKGVMRQCPVMLGWYGVVLAAMAVWGGHFTVAGWLLTAVAVAVLAVNVVASRSKSYTSGEKQFLNWMQICAAISFVGTLIFAICITTADLVGFYLGAEVSSQILAESASSATEAGSAAKFFVYVLALCTAVVLVSVFKSVMGLLSRAACMNDPESEAAGNSFGAITIGAIVVVVNAIVMSIFDLTLPAGQKGAFVACFVGIFVALAGQILLVVMRNVKMSDVTAEEVKAVMCGCSVADLKPADESEFQAPVEHDEKNQ